MQRWLVSGVVVWCGLSAMALAGAGQAHAQWAWEAAGANHPAQPPQAPTAPSEPTLPELPELPDAQDRDDAEQPLGEPEPARQATAGQPMSLEARREQAHNPLHAEASEAGADEVAVLQRPAQQAGANAPAGEAAEQQEPDEGSREQIPLGGDAGGEDAGGASLDTRGGWLLNTLAALAIVVGLIFLVRFIYSRVSGHVAGKPSAAVEVLSRTPVAPKNHILLVRVGPRVLVVGDSSSGLRTLQSVEDPQEVADLLAAVTASRDQSISQSFTSMLDRFSGEHDARGGDPQAGGDESEVLVDRARDSVSGLMARVRAISNRGGQA